MELCLWSESSHRKVYGFSLACGRGGIDDGVDCKENAVVGAFPLLEWMV